MSPARAKRLALIAGGGLALLLAAALVLPSIVDWSRYRDRIAALAAEATGRHVSIAGEVAFSLLPTPAFRAGQVRIANLPGGQAEDFASLAHLDVVVALWPLLEGELKVRRIILDRPEIALEHLPDGRFNWHFPAFTRRSGAADSIGLERVEIRGGRISYRALGTGRVYAAEAVDLRLSAQSLAGPYRLAGSASAGGVKSEFSLRTGRFGGAEPTPLHAQLEAAGAAVTFTGRIGRSPDGARPRARGDFALEGEDFGRLIRAVDRMLGRAGGGETAPRRWPGPFALAGRIELEDRLRLSALDATYAGSRLRGEVVFDAGERPRTEAAIRADSLDLDRLIEASGLADADPFTLMDALPGTLPLDLDLSLAFERVALAGEIVSGLTLDATAAERAILIERLRAQLPGASDTTFAGRFDLRADGPAFSGKLALSTADLRRVLAWFGWTPPGRADRFRVARVNADILATRDRLALGDLQLRLDATRAQGRLALSRAAEGPQLAADLTLDRLDLDRYLPRAPAEAPTIATAAKTEAAIAAALAEVAPLRGRAALAVGRLGLAGQRLRDVRLHLALAEGVLTIEEAQIGDVLGASGHFAGRLMHRPGDDRGAALEADLLLRVSVPEPEPLGAWLGLEPLRRAAAAAPLTVEGRIGRGRDGLSLDLSGSLAGGRATLAGMLAEPFAPTPGPLALTLGFDHPSHRALAERFGLELLSRGTALPVKAAADLSGDVDRLAVTIDSGLLGGEARFEGALTGLGGDTPRLAGDFEATHPDSLRLVRQFLPNYRPSGEPFGRFTLAAEIGAEAERFTLAELSATIGDARLEGRITVHEGERSRPRIVADLEAGALPIGRFLPATETAAGPARPGSGRRWSTKAFDLGGLAALDGRLELRAAAIAAGPFRLEPVMLALALENGRLVLERLSGALFGGQARIAGTFVLADRLPALTGEIALENANLAPALAALAAPAFGDGRFDLRARFETRGSSPFALASALSGEAMLTVSDGILAGFDLPRLAAGIERLDSPAQAADLIAEALGQGQTLLERLDASIAIESGRVVAEAVTAQLGSGTLKLRSEIDLPAWSIAASGRLTLAGHPAAPPIPLEIGGALSAPRIAFEPRALRLWLERRLATPAIAPIPLSEAIANGPQGLPEVVGPDAPAKGGADSGGLQPAAATGPARDDPRRPEGRDGG